MLGSEISNAECTLFQRQHVPVVTNWKNQKQGECFCVHVGGSYILTIHDGLFLALSILGWESFLRGYKPSADPLLAHGPPPQTLVGGPALQL